MYVPLVGLSMSNADLPPNSSPVAEAEKAGIEKAGGKVDIYQ